MTSVRTVAHAAKTEIAARYGGPAERVAFPASAIADWLHRA